MLDDIIIYRRGETNFMVVVNAANEPKIKFYLHELMEGRAVVDTEESAWAAKLPGLRVDIWDMRDPNRAEGSAGGHCLAGSGVDGDAREADGRCRRSWSGSPS